MTTNIGAKLLTLTALTSVSQTGFFARGCAPTIMQRLPSEDAVSLAQQLKSATEENDRRFGSNSVSDRYGPIAHLYS